MGGEREEDAYSNTEQVDSVNAIRYQLLAQMERSDSSGRGREPSPAAVDSIRYQRLAQMERSNSSGRSKEPSHAQHGESDDTSGR
eukprot:5492234-Prymnesium_polylepis.1